MSVCVWMSEYQPITFFRNSVFFDQMSNIYQIINCTDKKSDYVKKNKCLLSKINISFLSLDHGFIDISTYIKIIR